MNSRKGISNQSYLSVEFLDGGSTCLIVIHRSET